jgi:hypothetical protein
MAAEVEVLAHIIILIMVPLVVLVAEEEARVLVVYKVLV